MHRWTVLVLIPSFNVCIWQNDIFLTLQLLYEGESISNQPTLLPFQSGLLFFYVSTLQHDTFSPTVFRCHHPHWPLNWIGNGIYGYIILKSANRSNHLVPNQATRRVWYYSRLWLSRTRLSRITAYLEVKIWSLFKHECPTTGNKVLWKRGEIAPKEQFLPFSTIFSIHLKLQESNYISFVKCGCSIYFFFNSANLICRGTDISKYFRVLWTSR